MRDTLVYFIGKPGSGKYTISQELAKLTQAKLIDNHKINNVIFNVTKITDDNLSELFLKIDRIRECVFETIVQYREQESSFVLTNVLMADDPEDIDIFKQVENVARDSGMVFCPVVLTPPSNFIKQHISSNARKKRHKISCPNYFEEKYQEREVYIPHDHPHLLVIDNSDMMVSEAVQKVIQHIQCI